PTPTKTPSSTPTAASTPTVPPPGTPCPAPAACTGTALSGCVYAILSSNTCLSCHGGGRQAPNFSTACSAYSSLVNVADTGCTGTIVIPGNAANSTLIQRVNGTGSCNPMPQGGAPLTAAQIAVLTAWINAGAPPAGTNGW
ncbi:MAG TPA: hypothetical protein VJ873_07085, partial [bacterium]|nr:hypothetical protein [bacterium]